MINYEFIDLQMQNITIFSLILSITSLILAIVSSINGRKHLELTKQIHMKVHENDK